MVPLSILLWSSEGALLLLISLCISRSPKRISLSVVAVCFVALGLGFLESLRGYNFHLAGVTYDSRAILGVSEMRAAVYTVEEEVGWKMSKVPVPHHTDLSVLVRVKAVALNPSNFKHPMIPAAWPFIRHLRNKWPIGYDVAGEVLSVGKSSMCDVGVGDRVWGMSLGVSAEYAVIPCSSVVPVPAQLSFAEAAGLGVAGLTTLLGYERSSLQKGQSVLVIGASGGTGQFGVMLAAAIGANVTGIAGKRNVQFVSELKPGPSLVVDYSSSDQMSKLVKDGPQFDLIYDTVSSGAPEDPNYEPQLRPLLKPGGLYQAIGGPVPSMLDQVRAFLDVATRPLGISAQREAYDWFLLQPSKGLMQRLNSFFESGKMAKVPIDSAYDAMASDSAISDAMTRQQSRRAVGKIVLTF